jgi:hypothetical protein
MLENKELHLDFEKLKNMTTADRNKEITSYFEALAQDAKLEKENVNKMVAKLMKGTKGSKMNKIAAFAKGLNSVPAVITTVLISPYVLGWLIPRFTYANTRRLHAKAENERKAKIENVV